MVNDLGLVSLVDQIQQDVRYALRTLGRAPVFTAAAVLTLSLGIAANTAVFSLINTTLLKPIDAPEVERLVRVGTRSLSSLTGLSPGDYDLVQRQATIFSETAAHRTSSSAPSTRALTLSSSTSGPICGCRIERTPPIRREVRSGRCRRASDRT